MRVLKKDYRNCDKPGFEEKGRDPQDKEYRWPLEAQKARKQLLHQGYQEGLQHRKPC